MEKQEFKNPEIEIEMISEADVIVTSLVQNAKLTGWDITDGGEDF